MTSALLLLLLAPAAVACAAEADIARHIETIRRVGPMAQGNRQAVLAWRALAEADASALTEVLAGMDGAGPLAVNYLRAAVDAIAQRQLDAGGKLPADALEQFVLDRKHHPRARRLAYEWLARADAAAPDRLLPGMLDDPSLELRYDAVARVLDEASERQRAGDQAEAIATYRRVLSAARNIDQINQITEQLRKLGQEVDVTSHFGFVTTWWLIGPFDNRDKAGFNRAYTPETQVDLKASYAGKEGQVAWFTHTTPDEYGTVDLNKAIGKHMGAAAYAAAEFHSDRQREVDVRLGCINANKVWLNGEPLMQAEAYHAGTRIDQYVARATLQPGRNVILVKVCQNEQTEEWAQRWQFQLRVCDEFGTAVRSRGQ